MGLIQIDSVNVLVRSQELPLFARLGPHPRTLIPDATAARELFEYWVHEASIVPTEHHHAPPLEDGSVHTSGGVAATLEERRPGFVEEVYGRVADDGPIAAANLASASARRARGGTGTTARSRWSTCSGRAGVGALGAPNDFARLYDLTERVIPARSARAPDTDRERCAQGAAGARRAAPRRRDARRSHRLPPAEDPHLQAAARRTGRRGRVWCRSRWRGGRSRRTCIPTPSCRDGSARARCSARSTRSCWNRDRTERLFGFHYRIEIYTPQPKRHLRLLRAAVPARRLARRPGRPEGRSAARRAARAGSVRRARRAGRRGGRRRWRDELRTMAGWLGLDARRASATVATLPPRCATRGDQYARGVMADLTAGPDAARRSSRERMPRWVWKAIAVFWLGYLVHRRSARRSFASLSGLLRPAARLAVPFVRDRARRQPAGAPRLATRLGDRRHPPRRRRRVPRLRRRDRHAGRQPDRRPARATPRSTSTEPSTSSTTRSARTSTRSEVDRRDQRPGRARSSVHPSQAGQVLDLSVTALGVLVQGLSVMLFTFYLVADGPRLRRVDLQPAASDPPALGARAPGSWRSTRPAATCTRGRCSPASRRSSTGSCSRPSARRRRSHWRCGWASISQFLPVVGTYLAGVLPVLITFVDSPPKALVVIVFILRVPADRELPVRAAHHRAHHGAAPGGGLRCRRSAVPRCSGAVGGDPGASGGRDDPGARRARSGRRYEIVESDLTALRRRRAARPFRRRCQRRLATRDRVDARLRRIRCGLTDRVRAGRDHRPRADSTSRFTSARSSGSARPASRVRVGDPAVAVYPRSSNKPMQAVAMVRAGLALPRRPARARVREPRRHAAALSRWLCCDPRRRRAGRGRRSGTRRSCRSTTPHASSWSEPAAADVRSDELQRQARGHARDVRAQPLGARPHLPATRSTRCSAASPTTIDELSGEAPAHIGVDGCGAPAHVMSLVGLARAFRTIATGGGGSRGCRRCARR